jgi:hypothetical protein
LNRSGEGTLFLMAMSFIAARLTRSLNLIELRLSFSVMATLLFVRCACLFLLEAVSSSFVRHSPKPLPISNSANFGPSFLKDFPDPLCLSPSRSASPKHAREAIAVPNRSTRRTTLRPPGCSHDAADNKVSRWP